MLKNSLFAEVTDDDGFTYSVFPSSFLDSVFTSCAVTHTTDHRTSYPSSVVPVQNSVTGRRDSVIFHRKSHVDENGLPVMSIRLLDESPCPEEVFLQHLSSDHFDMIFVKTGKISVRSNKNLSIEGRILDVTNPEIFMAFLLSVKLGFAEAYGCDEIERAHIFQGFKDLALLSSDFFDLSFPFLSDSGLLRSERPEETSSDFINRAYDFLVDYDFKHGYFLRFCPICHRYERADSFSPIYDKYGCFAISVCDSCADTISRECSFCGNRHFVSEFQWVEYHTSEGTFKNEACNFCRTSKFSECTRCGDLWLDRDLTDIRSSESGKVVESLCPTCFEDNEDDFVQCPHCDEYYTSGENFIKVSNGGCVCRSCINDDYFLCEDCSEYCPNDDLVVIDGDRYVCESCFESGNYATCESCGEAHYTEDMYYHEGEGYYCQHCEDEREPEDDDYCEESNLINSYGYKPTPEFHRAENDTSNLYLGVELEYNFDSQSDCNDAVQEIEDDGNERSLFYYKHDSSLTNGCEFVSHPATLAYWKEYGIKNNIFKYLGSADVCDHTGLHIHISRKRMTDPHKIRINAFVYKNPDLLKFLARRDESSYAKFKKIELGSIEDSCDQNDRYEALNWYNDSTLEFRLFKSTTDEKHFLSCLEFCHASYIFTKTQIGIAELMNKDEKYVLDKFVKFVSNDTRYKELKNEIAKFCSKK